MIDNIKEFIFDNLLPICVFIVIICLLFKYKIQSDYDQECIYEYDQFFGVVQDLERDSVLACSYPVIYRIVYKTIIEMPDGTLKSFSGSDLYHACEIGDEVLIEIEYKYHDGDLISTSYQTVDITKVN